MPIDLHFNKKLDSKSSFKNIHSEILCSKLYQSLLQGDIGVNKITLHKHMHAVHGNRWKAP